MIDREAEGRILETLRDEYLRTGDLDWWAARDLCFAAAVPEEFFGPAVEAMVPRRLVETRIDPKGDRWVRLARTGTSRTGASGTGHARDRVAAAPDRGRNGAGLLARCLGALIRPLRGLVP